MDAPIISDDEEKVNVCDDHGEYPLYELFCPWCEKAERAYKE